VRWSEASALERDHPIANFKTCTRKLLSPLIRRKPTAWAMGSSGIAANGPVGITIPPANERGNEGPGATRQGTNENAALGHSGRGSWLAKS
jgi:hypothetical protein